MKKKTRLKFDELEYRTPSKDAIKKYEGSSVKYVRFANSETREIFSYLQELENLTQKDLKKDDGTNSTRKYMLREKLHTIEGLLFYMVHNLRRD